MKFFNAYIHMVDKTVNSTRGLCNERFSKKILCRQKIKIKIV